LQLNTTGSSNTALGQQALYSNTTASNNTAVGYQALYANTTGTQNTALGYQAGDAITTASENTAIGYQALTNATSNSNTAIGRSAGSSITTGSQNICLGEASGLVLADGDRGIYIGKNSSASSAGADYEMVIATSNATGKGTNTGFITANGGGLYQGDNSSTWSTTSDRRIKKNIVDNNDGLEKLMQVRVRNFEYRAPEEVDPELPQSAAIDKDGVQLGVIAQEIQEVFPDVVKEESTGVLSVNPDNLTWYLVNAVKDLKTELDAAKAEIEALKGA